MNIPIHRKKRGVRKDIARGRKVERGGGNPIVHIWIGSKGVIVSGKVSLWI